MKQKKGMKGYYIVEPKIKVKYDICERNMKVLDEFLDYI